MLSQFAPMDRFWLSTISLSDIVVFFITVFVVWSVLGFLNDMMKFITIPLRLFITGVLAFIVLHYIT